jgi:hypothetical protein
MNMRLSDLVEMIGKKPLAPGTTHLVVELLVCDEEGEDVDVSSYSLLFYSYSLSLYRFHTLLSTFRWLQRAMSNADKRSVIHINQVT